MKKISTTQATSYRYLSLVTDIGFHCQRANQISSKIADVSSRSCPFICPCVRTSGKANMFLHIFVLAACTKEAKNAEHPHEERLFLHGPSPTGHCGSNLCGSNLGSFEMIKH